MNGLKKDVVIHLKIIKKQIKGCLKPISLEMVNKAMVKLVLIPGKKLCPNCQIQIHKLLPDEEPRHVSDEEIQELEAGTSAESEKSSNNKESKMYQMRK